MMTLKTASTDNSIYVRAVDDRTGQATTGLTAGVVSAYYARGRSAAVAVPVVALASPDAAHADGGFIEVDPVGMPGLYRFDLPDAVAAVGAVQVVVMLTAADALFSVFEAALSSGTLADVAPEVHLCKAALVNKRQHTISTGVDVIMDDDGTTTLVTLTPVDGGNDVIEVTPS